MLNKLILLFVVLVAILASVDSVLAVQAPILVYVDTAYVGSESGTEAEPYNTIEEAVWKAQNSAGGGVLYLKTNGEYVYNRFVSPVRPGPTGIPMAGPVLYGLLAVLSLLLILAGWQLRRRSRQLQHS
jgi:hypothetical protein